MASITINGVIVTLPDIITANSPGLPPLGIGRVAVFLQNIPFPIQVTNALQSRKGELRITYTGNDTLAYPCQELGRVHHRHQGGDHWVNNRAASYEIAVDYQFIDGTSYRLFDISFNTPVQRSCYAHHEHANPDIHVRQYQYSCQQAAAQNAIPLATFLQNSWDSAFCRYGMNPASKLEREMKLACAISRAEFQMQKEISMAHKTAELLQPRYALALWTAKSRASLLTRHFVPTPLELAVINTPQSKINEFLYANRGFLNFFICENGTSRMVEIQKKILTFMLIEEAKLTKEKRVANATLQNSLQDVSGMGLRGYSSVVVEMILTREKEEAEAAVRGQKERAERIALIQKMCTNLAPIAVAAQLTQWQYDNAFSFMKEHYPIVAEFFNFSILNSKELKNSMYLPSQAETQAYARTQGIPLRIGKSGKTHGHESQKPQKQLEKKVENDEIPDRDNSKIIASSLIQEGINILDVNEQERGAFIQDSSNIIASRLMQEGINVSDINKQEERDAFIKASTHAGSMIAFHLMRSGHIEAGMAVGRGIRAIALNKGLAFKGERLNLLGYSIEDAPIPSMPFVENRQPVTSLQSAQSSATASSVAPNVAYQYEDNDIQAILSVRLQQLRIQNPQQFTTPLEILAAVDNIEGVQLENRLRQEAGNHQGARILLIPCNLGNAHWVGILLELRADGTESRSEYIDSLTTNPIVPETFQAQLQQVYPNARFQTLELLKQNDYTSCGAYTIENLLVSALRIPLPNPETIRVLHLEALRQYNPIFYNAFNERQRNNRPTTATLHEQLFHLDRLKNIWFSKQELSRILEIKKYLSILPEEIKAALLQAFQHNTAYNDNHALHLNTIRTALEKVAQLESKALAELMQLLFDMPAQPGTSLSFRDIKFRVGYEEILAVTQCHLVPEQIRDLQQTLTEQIKQDAEFARKLQADLWSDNEARFLGNSSSRTNKDSDGSEVLEPQVNPSVVFRFDSDNIGEQLKSSTQNTQQLQSTVPQPAAQHPSPLTFLYSNLASILPKPIIGLIQEYYVDPKEVEEFLRLVAEGEQDKAEAMLKINPALALVPGDVTDLSKRTFTNITGFQYAVWALDWHMWTMLRKYLPDEEARVQSQGFKTGSWVENHGVHANLRTDGKPGNLDTLIQAYQTTNYLYNKAVLCKAAWTDFDLCKASWPEGTAWTKGYTAWVRQVGGAQLLLPAHVINEYCHPTRPFYPLPNFKDGLALPRSRKINEGEWFTVMYQGGKLGEKFSMYRGEGDRPWTRSDLGFSGGRDPESVFALTITRTAQREELIAELKPKNVQRKAA